MSPPGQGLARWEQTCCPSLGRAWGRGPKCLPPSLPASPVLFSSSNAFSAFPALPDFSVVSQLKMKESETEGGSYNVF